MSYILWYFDLNVYPEARFATDADLEKVGRRRSLTSVMPACSAGSTEAMACHGVVSKLKMFGVLLWELIRLIEEILVSLTLYRVDIDFLFFFQADGLNITDVLSCLIFRQHIPSTREDNVKKIDLK